MDYSKIYNNLIEFRKEHKPGTGYTEIHHILPKSLGGSDNPDNLVTLTAREHFVCHLLLVKIKLPQYEHAKMVKAFMSMLTSSNVQDRHVTARSYERLRAEFAQLQSEAQSGDKNSQYGTKWIYSIELRICKKINKFDIIPDGWCLGRVIDFDYADKRTQELRDWYSVYTEIGFNAMCEVTGYEHSRPNLIWLFKRFVPEFSRATQRKQWK
jgi:hypothetical protein